MRQNPFFFRKADSATNGFKAEDIVNTSQIGEGGRGTRANVASEQNDGLVVG